jgi:hypothetical protein
MKSMTTNGDWDSQNIFNWNGLRQLKFDWMIDFFYPYGGLIWQHNGILGIVILWVTPAVVSYIVVKKEFNIFLIFVSQLSIVGISQIDIYKFSRYAFPLALVIYLMSNYHKRVKFQLILIFIFIYSVITFSDATVALIICSIFVLLIRILNYFKNGVEIFYADYIISGVIISLIVIKLIIADPQRYLNLIYYWINIINYSYGQTETPYVELIYNPQNVTTLGLIIFLLLGLYIVSKFSYENVKNPNYILIVLISFYMLTLYSKDFVRPDMGNSILMCMIVITPSIVELVQNYFYRIAFIFLILLANLSIITNFLSNSRDNLQSFGRNIVFVAINSNKILDSKVIRNSFFDQAIENHLSQDLDVKDLKKIIGSESIYVLGHYPTLYNHFRQSKWIMNMYDLSPYESQVKLLNQLSIEKTRFVIRPKIGSPPVDNIDYRVRVPLVYKYIYENYSQFYTNESFDLFILKNDTNYDDKIDFGTSLDLGALPAKSSYLNSELCKNYNQECTRVLDVGIKDSKYPEKKVELLIISGEREYRVLFNTIKDISEYSFNLENLWFYDGKSEIVCTDYQLDCQINNYQKIGVLY